MAVSRRNAQLACGRLADFWRNLLRERWGNPSVLYASAFGWVAIVALAISSAGGEERQKAIESLAAHVAPFDEQMPGYNVVDPSLASTTLASRISLVGMSAEWWGMTVLLMTAAGTAIWYVCSRTFSQRYNSLQCYRRPRATRPTARVTARRRKIMDDLGQSTTDQGRRPLTVQRVMSDAMVFAAPSSSTKTLTKLLMSSPVRHIMICDAAGHLLGIVTDRDLRNRRGKCAADIMTREPVCVSGGALLAPAAALMVDHQISCLPVIDDGRLRGLLTSDDVTLALECVLQSSLAPVRATRAVEETLVLSDVQGLCDTVRAASGVAHAAVEVASPVSS